MEKIFVDVEAIIDNGGIVECQCGADINLAEEQIAELKEQGSIEVTCEDCDEEFEVTIEEGED